MPKRKTKRNINLVKVKIVPPSEPAFTNAYSKLTAAAESTKSVTSVDVNVVETNETTETNMCINSAKCTEKEANSPYVKETESTVMKTSILEDKKSSKIDKSLENRSQGSQLELKNIISSQNLSKNSENAEVTKKNIPKHFANLRNELLFLKKYNYKYSHKSKISQQKSNNNAVLRTPPKTRTFLQKDADSDKMNVKFTPPEVNSEQLNIKSESTKYISEPTKPVITKVKSESIEVKSESIKVKPKSSKVKSTSKAFTSSSIITQQSQAISKTSNADSIKSSNVSEKSKTTINVKQVPHQVEKKCIATVENLRKSYDRQKSSKQFEETRIVSMKPTISSSKRNLSSKSDHKLYTEERVVKKKETDAYKEDHKNKQYTSFKDKFYWEKENTRSKRDYKHQKVRSSKTEEEYIHCKKKPYTWINDSKKEIHRKEVLDEEEMQIEENYFEEVEVASDEELSKSSEILIGFRKYKKFYLHSLKSSYFKPKIFYVSPERTFVNCVEKISGAEELDEVTEIEGSDKDTVCVDEVIIIDCPVSLNDVNSSYQSTNFKEDSGMKDTLEVPTEVNSTSLTEKSSDPPEEDNIKNIAESRIEFETNTALDDEESGNEVEIIEVDDDEIFDEIEECLSDTAEEKSPEANVLPTTAEDKSPEENVLQTTAEDKSPEENVLQTTTKVKNPEVEVIDIDEKSESGINNSDEVVCSQSIDKLISTVQILREKEKVATAIKVPRKYLEFRSKLHLEIGKFYQGPSVCQVAIDAWNSHLIGLEYMLEVRDNLKAVVAEKFICTLCCITLNKNIGSQILIDHITGYSHMIKYMEKHFPSCGSKISEHVSLYNRKYLMIECYEAINGKLGYQYLCYTDKICLELYGDDIYKNIASIKHFDESDIQLNMDKYIKSLSNAILLDVRSTINHIVEEIDPNSATIIILDDDNSDDVNKKVDKIKKVNDVSPPIKTSVLPISTLNTFTIPVAHRESRDGAFQLLKKTSLSFSNTRTSTRSNLVQIPVQETLNSNTKPISATVLMQSIETEKANNAKQILGAEHTKSVIKKNVQPIKKASKGFGKVKNLFSKKNISGAHKNQSQTTVKSQPLTKEVSDQDVRLVRMVTKKCGNFSVQVDNESDSEDISALHEEISDTDLVPEDVLPILDVQQETKNICVDDSSQDIRSVSNLDDSVDNSVIADDNSMGRTAHKRKPEKTTLHSKHCIKRILGRNKSIKGHSDSIDEETSSSYRQRSPASSETSSKYRRLSRSPVHQKITSPLRISRSGFRRYSRSPIRRRSNSRSPIRRRLRSPYRKRSSPIRRRSRSPFYNKHSRSPFRRRSRSPIRRRSRSPIRGRRSRSPFRRSKSPLRRRSRSPFRRQSRSPIRRQSRSPVRRQSRSPVRRLSRSPVRRLSRSPVRRLSRSPVRRRSRSPVRRRSRSPVRRQSRSPVRRRSKSPLYRHPVSQSGEYSYNTERRYIRSPIKESPGLRVPRSPLREVSISPIRKYGVHRYSNSPDVKHLSTSNSRFDSRSNSPVLKHYKDNIGSTSKGKYSPPQRGLDQNADLDPISDEDESIYFNTNERPQHLDEIMKISEPMRSLILQIIKKFSLTNANPRDPAFLELLKYVNTHSEAAEQLISQPSQNFDSQKQNMNPSLALQNALLQQQALDFRGNFPQSMYPQMATYNARSGQSSIPFLTPSPMFSQGIQLPSQVSPALTHFQQNTSLASNLQQQRPLAHPYNLLQQLQQRPSGKEFTAFKDLKATVNKLFGASAPVSTSSTPLQPRATTTQSFMSQVANYGNKDNFKKIDFIDLINEPPTSLEVPPSDAKVTFCEQPRIMQKRNIFPVIGGASTSGHPASVEVAKKTLAQRLASVLVKAGMIDVSAPLLQEMLMKIGAFSPRPPQDIKESEILDILKKLRYLS